MDKQVRRRAVRAGRRRRASSDPDLRAQRPLVAGDAGARPSSGRRWTLL